MTTTDHATFLAQERRESIQWAPVAGFEGLYEISENGEVRGLHREREGTRLLHTRMGRNGYLVVALSRQGKATTINVHALVARSFLGPPPDHHEINHIDGDKGNPSLSNLEYVTRSDNLRHAYRTGLRKPLGFKTGERHPNHRLSDADVAEIRRRFKLRKYGSTRLAREFNVHHSTIQRIVTDQMRPLPGQTAHSALADCRSTLAVIQRMAEDTQ